jgi:hypothetical protein
VKSDGVLPLPSGFTWRALNDRDEIVGDCNDPAPSDCAAYYSPDRGLIRLTVSGLKLTSAVAINKAGRILANASSLGSSAPAAVLLVPGSELILSFMPAYTSGSPTHIDHSTRRH